MDFAQSLGYLDALILHGVKVGLDHTRCLAGLMGLPQQRIPSVLIAGTNGKGSTAAFLEAVLRASGLRTGLFTSPHLVDVRERVRVEGRLIDEGAFAEGMARVRGAAEAALREGSLETAPTYFEALTLLALDHFAREGVQAAVLEVGLGGRLDCTNIVEPEISLITNIGLDHQEFLGADLPSIAREKAGILRRGRPALTGASDPDSLRVLVDEAARIGADLEPLAPEQLARVGAGWRLDTHDATLALPEPSLAGRHQLANASLAALCAWRLKGLGWPVTEESIRAGLAHARWPGRLETISERPLVILDGAHNRDGCAALAAYVRDLPQTPRALVFAAMRDKPVEEMAALLVPQFQAVWATQVPMARCCPAAKTAERLGVAAVAEDPVAAIEAARERVGPEGLVVVAGSLYLVGHVKAALGGVPARSWGSGL